MLKLMLKIERFLQPKFLLTAMILLQTLWLITGWALAYRYDYVPSLQNPYKMSFIIAFTLVVGLMIISLPTQVLSQIRQIKEHLLKNKMHLLLVLGAIVLIVAGIYINNLRWGSDEEAFFNAAMIMVEKVEFFEAYAQTWMARQHPPLPHIVTGFFMQIFGDDLFIMRFVVTLIGIATVLLIYFIGCELYDRQSGFFAALFLLSLPRFLQHSTVVAGNDIFLTFFFTLAVFLLIRLQSHPSYWLSIKTGVAIGMGLLSKYTMILIYPMLLSLLFFKRYQLKTLILHLGIISLISMSLLGIWLVIANDMGILSTQSQRMVFHAGLEQHEGVPSLFSWWRIQYRLKALFIEIPSALGVYNIPLLLLGGLSLVRRRSQSDWFILLWIAVVFVPIMLILPDNRYFMPAFPALAIAMAHGVRLIPSVIEQTVVLALLYSMSTLYLFVSL